MKAARGDEPWYVEAFRDDYREVYSHRDHAAARREVAWLVERGVQGAVLDLGCGFGRHTAALRAAGCHAFGIDLSADLLRASSVHAESASVAGRLVRGDARFLPFADAAFDSVVVLFSSFGYFGADGDVRVLREIARVLRSGGLVVLDLMNPARIRATLVPESRTERGELVIDERRRLEDGGRVVAKDVRLSRRGSAERSWTERVRMYELAELDALLAGAGLERSAVSGDFDATPASASAARQIVFARRR